MTIHFERIEVTLENYNKRQVKFSVFAKDSEQQEAL